MSNETINEIVDEFLSAEAYMKMHINELLMTPTGNFINPYDINSKGTSLSFRDISISLARTARWNGATQHFYSVAHHLLLGKIWIDALDSDQKMLEDFQWYINEVSPFYKYAIAVAFSDPKTLMKEWLFHDMHEMFIGDIPGPLKCNMPDVLLAEKKIDAELREFLELPERQTASIEYRRFFSAVKLLDKLTLAHEFKTVVVKSELNKGYVLVDTVVGPVKLVLKNLELFLEKYQSIIENVENLQLNQTIDLTVHKAIKNVMSSGAIYGYRDLGVAALLKSVLLQQGYKGYENNAIKLADTTES